MKNINRFSAIKGKLKTALLIILLSIILVGMLFAQENVKIDSIRTSAQCGMCKERIENHLNKQEDILESVLDVETAVCTVKYDSTKITIDDIRKEISKIGYDADEVKANKRTYNKLPKCCKKPEDR
ncbi:MAG: heavy metal-associated domain-containing protein [bacterium]